MQGLILIIMLFVIFIIYFLILCFAKGFFKKIVFSLLFTFIWAGDQIVAGVAMHYYCNKYSHVKIYEKPQEVNGFIDWMGASEGLLKESGYTWVESPVMENGLVAERFIKKNDEETYKETNVKPMSRYQINYKKDKINLLIVSINRRHWWLVDRYTSKKLSDYCGFSPEKDFLTYFPIIYTMFADNGRCHSITKEVVDVVRIYKYFL